VIPTKCKWKHCKLGGEVEKQDAIELQKGQYYHKECEKELGYYHQIKKLYTKYYNENESWAIIGKTLSIWIDKYGTEFILFCLCKAIRNRVAIRKFQGLYYVLTDRKYMDEYKKYQENQYDKQKLYGEFVLLRESEYYKLTEQLGEKSTVYYINKLNQYIKSSGKEYSSHYETILLWKENDDKKTPVSNGIVIHDS
jgi:hypothetical protein